jgi:spermidine synthase
MLRVLEPPGSSQKDLWEALMDGTYNKPFILDSGARRCLHFDLDAVQSVMQLEDPDKLCLAYTRKMMAFLLFNRAPKRILLLGLGGGSLAKFCYRRLNCASITAIEVNPDVIALRDEFLIPADDERFRVIRADGMAYVSSLALRKDVILADACDRLGVAPAFNAIEFYQNVRRGLSRRGVFVINLCGDAHSRSAHMLKIRETFGSQCLRLQVRTNGNVIVLAFREEPPEIDWVALKATAADLKRKFELDFPNYLQRIALDYKLRRWERASA